MYRIQFVGRLYPSRFFFSNQALAILISVIGLVISGAVVAASWETSSLRAPGGGLIRIGMTRQEVLKELGQSVRSHSNTAARGKTAKQRNTLTYHGDDGQYTITFSGERVSRIVVTPRRD